ncbi:hypothetical protein [Bacteroides xylanisolvens]|uniref:hypothetical protein n=1 Tax=Bacteroides xylanisolvens TaxID=371601 RepID=UPI001C37CAB8|nr:hypothetical protein [Bacteroides xylanisolvens]MBV3619420.1 hypothetical protein [Bacteroides xylanisolvens]
MKTNVSSAKGAQAKAAVLGNAVTNKKKEETPLLLLPSAPIQEKPKPETTKPETTKPETTKPETTQKLLIPMSIDVLMDKADRTYLLRQKYQEIRDKRKQLETFTISHDKNNAQLTLVDAKGLTISTSNPVSIGKLLADWMNDLNEHLKKTEDEIRAELEARN